jgi:hypothetical protein
MSTASKANDRQVAGTHYKGVAIQHWDYAAANALDYFEGQITKYVCRWRKKWPTAKGRLDDIQKALHFAEKLAEVASDPVRTMGVINTAVWLEAARIVGQPQYASYIRAVDFCAAQNLHPADAYVIQALEHWRLHGGEGLDKAVSMLETLVREAEQAVAEQADPSQPASRGYVDQDQQPQPHEAPTAFQPNATPAQTCEEPEPTRTHTQACEAAPAPASDTFSSSGGGDYGGGGASGDF